MGKDESFKEYQSRVKEFLYQYDIEKINITDKGRSVFFFEDEKEDEKKVKEDFISIVSPVTGIYYQSSFNNNEANVIKGSIVEKGDVLCVVEAMKIMYEIPSPYAGTILSINIKDKEIVREGEVLFTLQKPKEE